MITWYCRQCGELLEVAQSTPEISVECTKCGTPSRPPSTQPPPTPATHQTTRARSGGLFNALIGNASNYDPRKAAKEVQHLLVRGESIQLAYKLVRDLFVFTDRRLILIDKQGVTGKKVECHSIPYKSIVQFSVETAGTFDRDAELKVFVSGMHAPIHKQFRKGGANIFDVQRAIATAIIGD